MTKMVKGLPGFKAHAYEDMPYVDISDLVTMTNDGRLFWDADAVSERYWSAVRDTLGIEITLGDFKFEGVKNNG